MTLDKPTKKNTQKKKATQNITDTINTLKKDNINFTLTIKCDKLDFICTADNLLNMIMINNKNDDDKLKIDYKTNEILEKSVTFPINVIRQIEITLDIGMIDTYIPVY